MVLILPWPPTVNHYRAIVNGRLITSSKGRKYKSLIAEIAKRAKWESFGKSRLSIDITLKPPDRRRFDIDNRLKPLLDALEEAGLYENDNQIDELTVRRSEIGKPARAEIIIEVIND